MSTIQHAYSYRQPSFVTDGPAPQLSLATCDATGTVHPHFFDGRIRKPRLIAELLTAVHLVVGSRFFTPANSIARVIALADPVVTCGGGMLRFEGFSSCCSTYVRVDLMPDAYDGELVGKGTTNVDFNAPMRAALARIRDDAGLDLAIGRHEVRLRSAATEVTERKVALPMRWLRGMVEVQSYQAGMRRRFGATALEALRFFRTLPKTSTSRTPLWVARGASGLQATTRQVDDAVRVTDATRLRALVPLLPKASALSVFADDAQQASAWVLDFGDARLTLALSAETWRGFSGEGQALWALMQSGSGGVARELPRVRALLNWQSALDPTELSRELGTSPAVVANALRILGASGLVGFDVAGNNYFHRVLPFDLSMMEDFHPRLADARALLDSQAVSVVTPTPFEAVVASGGVKHRVREVDGTLHCTCPWFAKHKGARGPCKHVLAAAVLQPSLY
jgi:hypothetical protein